MRTLCAARRLRPGAIALLFLGLLALPGLAYASPPDPSWLAGLYDDADYDDVVVLVTSTSGEARPALLVDLRPTLAGVGETPSPLVHATPSTPASAVRLRAPPVS